MKDIRVKLFLLAAVMLVTALAGSGVLRRPDQWAQDGLFQRKRLVSTDIVIIGIDDESMDELGPYQEWGRGVIAEVLEVLAADPEKKPAATAIDVLYVGERNPDTDAKLANAAAKLGNVVTATLAEFGDEVLWENGRAAGIDPYGIMYYNEPFQELKDVTTQGHINAMNDGDGILRHALLYVDLPGGDRVYSMAAQTARLFLESKGEELKLPETSKRGHFFISYTAEPGGFYDGVSVSDVIYGRVPADYFAGKIVLVGPYASALQDVYYTPIDRARQMFGVETQANVIQAMIEQRYKKEIPDRPQLIALFFLSIGAFLLFLKGSILQSTILLLAFLFVSLRGAVFMFERGTVIHPLWLPVSIFTLFIFTVVNRYIMASIERNRVTQTFERYVAPEIVREILREGDAEKSLIGRECDIAVMFVDVRGFTSMSERMETKKILAVLNRYLSMTAHYIDLNHGTLDKFIGDATMAFWGAPMPQERAPYLAAKTALEIVGASKELSDELKKEIGEELHVGIGIHYGPAVVGNMGSERRMDYTAIGDTVNTASRLEANAPRDTVYISRAVADALGDAAVVRSLGDTVPLKGKAAGFEVLVLEALK